MATLTVTIKEELILNGAERGSENVSTISSVTEMMERIIDTPATSEITILTFDSFVAGGGTFVGGELKYLRVTNLDATNYATLRVLGTSEEYFVTVNPKSSFMLFVDEMDANATGSQAVNMDDIVSIKAQADTAEVQLEVFVAS